MEKEILNTFSFILEVTATKATLCGECSIDRDENRTLSMLCRLLAELIDLMPSHLGCDLKRCSTKACRARIIGGLWYDNSADQTSGLDLEKEILVSSQHSG